MSVKSCDCVLIRIMSHVLNLCNSFFCMKCHALQNSDKSQFITEVSNKCYILIEVQHSKCLLNKILNLHLCYCIVSIR